METTSERQFSVDGSRTVKTDYPYDLTVVIVNYNVCQFLEQALRSVYRAAAGLSMEVFVVDNDSVDGSPQMVRDEFPQVKLIVNESNVGFARANNMALRRAAGEFILVLNPDTIVQEDTLTTFIRFMRENPSAGAVGCRILNPDGTFARESRRSYPTPEVAFYKVSGLSRLFPKSRRFGRYNLTFLPENQVAEVDALSGSCMFVRHAALYLNETGYRKTGDTSVREALQEEDPDARPTPDGAGFLDEDFFMYGEDLDWCFRIRASGWKVFYTPDTQIIHFKGESTKRGELRYVRLFYGAMSRFVQKHFRSRHSKLFSAFLHLGIWVKATQSVLAQWLAKAKTPFFEWFVALLLIEAVAVIRSVPSSYSFPLFFYTVVVPAYATTILFFITAAGGYGRRRKLALKPVVQGTGMAFVTVTTISFFIKSVAFSRAVVLFGFLAAFIGIAVQRWIRREFSQREVGPRQAVIVGPAHSAERLRRMLLLHPRPLLEIVGYVDPADVGGSRLTKFTTIPRLGRTDQIRDIVRLRHVDDVVFAAEHVSNQAMFGLMRQLLDMPITFKIQQSDEVQLIGKSFVGNIGGSTPLLDLETHIRMPRAKLERYLSNALVAFGLMAAWLILAVPGAVLRSGSINRLGAVAAGTLYILLGRKNLVGHTGAVSYQPPSEWGIGPGVVPVHAGRQESSSDQLRQLYWQYAQGQSLLTDLRITLRFIRRGAHTTDHKDHVSP